MIPKNYALIYPNIFNYTVYKIIDLLFLIHILKNLHISQFLV